MFGPKVAVLVEVDHNIYSYVSHPDWAPVHQFLRTMGIRQENLKGPDQFDTVADRNGTRNSVSFGGSSESQVSPSSLLTTPLRQSVDGGRTEDHPIDELISSLTRNPMSSQLTTSEAEKSLEMSGLGQLSIGLARQTWKNNSQPEDLNFAVNKELESERELAQEKNGEGRWSQGLRMFVSNFKAPESVGSCEHLLDLF
ncbi:hypothetical protein CKAH01_17174 [Colletotrichum kahawae]|uniref:Uncharacterized protein n=1 Tax=Colletotrichum kahawae TaxID=34407 RepID=A0AAE0D7D9_COLKA|nr:hypothetical protein CKAH01_17174 [Colletotrichum kahawae]